jgi:hypothetical protein
MLFCGNPEEAGRLDRIGVRKQSRLADYSSMNNSIPKEVRDSVGRLSRQVKGQNRSRADTHENWPVLLHALTLELSHSRWRRARACNHSVWTVSRDQNEWHSGCCLQ